MMSLKWRALGSCRSPFRRQVHVDYSLMPVTCRCGGKQCGAFTMPKFRDLRGKKIGRVSPPQGGPGKKRGPPGGSLRGNWLCVCCCGAATTGANVGLHRPKGSD